MANDHDTHDDEELITMNELRKRLKISRSFAYTLINERGLPTVRIAGALRFRYSDVLDHFEKLETEEANG